METFYHGSTRLFDSFDLSHALEGDGKIKFGYGVYVTSSYDSAAHYANVDKIAPKHYVYTVEVPELTERNCIKFKQPVHPSIVSKTEEELNIKVPEKDCTDGKLFRKFLADHFNSHDRLEGEKAAAEFLDSIGVICVVWPYNWRKGYEGSTNRAVFNADRVKIVKVDEV